MQSSSEEAACLPPARSRGELSQSVAVSAAGPAVVAAGGTASRGLLQMDGGCWEGMDNDARSVPLLGWIIPLPLLACESACHIVGPLFGRERESQPAIVFFRPAGRRRVRLFMESRESPRMNFARTPALCSRSSASFGSSPWKAVIAISCRM